MTLAVMSVTGVDRPAVSMPAAFIGFVVKTADMPVVPTLDFGLTSPPATAE